MGFCLGGHPIFELARMNSNFPCNKTNVVVMFHDVLMGGGSCVQFKVPVRGGTDLTQIIPTKSMYLYAGEDDPFIASKDLNTAIAMFNKLGYQTNMMTFKDTKHGFMNSAQDYNPSNAFAYDEEAGKAWHADLSL